jgi:hypothetical protein
MRTNDMMQATKRQAAPGQSLINLVHTQRQHLCLIPRQPLYGLNPGTQLA